MTQPDRISLILRPAQGGTLEHVLPFAQLGAHVHVGRGLAVIVGASEGDLQAYLEQKLFELGLEREQHSWAMEYCERALGMHPLLVAHAREMYDLLRLINVKVGGLSAALDHSMEPSEQAWDEYHAALDDIWPLLERLAPALAADKDKSVPETGFSIDEHVKLVADARRYRWLRDRERIEDPDEDLLVVRGDNWISAEELDQEIDTALRLKALEQQVVLEHQP